MYIRNVFYPSQNNSLLQDQHNDRDLERGIINETVTIVPFHIQEDLPQYSLLYNIIMGWAFVLSIGDLYVALTFDSNCINESPNNNPSLFINLIVSGVLVMIWTSMHFVAIKQTFISKFWMEFAGYLLRAFILMWIMLGAVSFWAEKSTKCLAFTYWYIFVSFIAKCGLILTELAMSYKYCIRD